MDSSWLLLAGISVLILGVILWVGIVIPAIREWFKLRQQSKPSIVDQVPELRQTFEDEAADNALRDNFFEGRSDWWRTVDQRVKARLKKCGYTFPDAPTNEWTVKALVRPFARGMESVTLLVSPFGGEVLFTAQELLGDEEPEQRVGDGVVCKSDGTGDGLTVNPSEDGYEFKSVE